MQCIALLIPPVMNVRSERVKKQLLEEEMQYVRDESAPPRLPIEETNLSTDSITTTLVFSLIGVLLIIGAIAFQLFRYLYHPEEYLIGGSLIAMLVLLHFIFAFISSWRLTKDDFPKITPENRDEIYWELAECRDGKKGKLWLLPLLLVWLAVSIGFVFAFIYTPFGTEVIERMDVYRGFRDPSYVDSRIITIGEPETQIKIASSGGRDIFWTFVFSPFGFANDDEKCLLYSDLIRESLFRQTKEEAVKPTVEPMLLSPDFLMIPFFAQPKRQNDAAHYLENVVFGNQLTEPTFDTAKLALLEKLRDEKSNVNLCASKFALAARRQVVDFGNQHVVLLGDLEKADWTTFQEYYRNRFSRYKIPLVVSQSDNPPSIEAALDEVEQRLKPLTIDAERKPQPQGALPGEYRATWDAEFPAIVATWALPDPKEFPDEHGNTLLAIKAIEQQLLAPPNTETNIVAVQSGTFAAPEGLLVFVSVVWDKETPIENALSVFESQTSKITATSSIPDWLKTERVEVAIPIDRRVHFSWRQRSKLMQYNNSNSWHYRGASLYRYTLLLENEEQCKILGKSIAYANFYSVQRAFGKVLTKDNRTLVVLMPEAGH